MEDSMNFWRFGSQRRDQESDLDRELRSYIDAEAQDQREAGLSAEDASYAARRALGNTTQIKEDVRMAWGFRWIETLLQDLRYGLRQLRRNPGFTAVAVTTLALGIGANTAIFTVFDTVLLRALAVRQPSRLVMLTDPNAQFQSYGLEGGTRDLLGYPEFEYLRDHNSVFSSIFAADSEMPAVPVRLGSELTRRSGQVETAHVSLVSGDYFSTLGVRALRGRVFTSWVDKARRAAPVAVISYGYWDRRFNRDSSILGKTIEIRQTPFTVIGVAPPGFSGITVGEAPDLWVPLTMQAAVYPGRDMLSPVAAMQNEFIWLQAMARLKPGVTLKQAQANVSVLLREMLESQAGPGLTAAQRKDYLDQQIQLQPGGRGAAPVRGVMGDPLEVLMGLVGIVLLIACANVANLFLARGAVLQREFAIRAAIGAGRARLIRQLMAESFLLAFLGAAVGVLLAQRASALLARTMPGVEGATSVIHLDLAPDWRVLGFTLAITVITALLFGLAPAWRTVGADISPVLKSATAGPADKAHNRFYSPGKLLVAGQVSASLILLVAAGLFVHTLARLSEVRLGYNPEHLLLFRVDAAAAGYQGNAMTVFCRRMLGRLAAIPGVSSATVSSGGLFEGSDSGDPIAVEGYTPRGGESPHARMDMVGPGYFDTVGIPILLGREIEDSDAAPAPRAAVINQAFAQVYFAHTSPLGKVVRDTFPGNPGAMEVVGIAADTRHNSLRERIRPRIYFPLFNLLWPERSISFEVRTAADPATVSAAIREAAGEINEALLPLQMETLPGLVDQSLGDTRFIAGLAGLFALVAALLAGIGLYGVMAYRVARQTREIGIRMALGAAPRGILWLVLRETLLLVAIGVAVGVPLAIAGESLVRSLLFGLGRVDVPALVLATALLAAVAAIAGLVPARRAAHVDPMVALRCE
jgi:predicted permease